MLFRWSRVLLGDKWKHQCGVVWGAASSEAGGAVYTSHGKHSCRSTRASRMSGALIDGCGECFWASACSGAHQRRVDVTRIVAGPVPTTTAMLERSVYMDDGQVFMRPTAAPPEEVLLQTVTKKHRLPFQFQGSNSHVRDSCVPPTV